MIILNGNYVLCSIFSKYKYKLFFFSSVLNERVLDRNIASEDYDQPIQDFLMAKSEYSIFGLVWEIYITYQKNILTHNISFICQILYLLLKVVI